MIKMSTIQSWLVSKDPSDDGFRKPSSWGHAVIASLVILASLCVYITSVLYINFLSRKWHICPLNGDTNALAPASRPGAASRPGEPSEPSALIHGNSQQPNFDELYARITELDMKSILPAQKERLKTQLNQLRQAQITSCEIGVFFYANRTAALTVVTAAGILAITILAFISKEGWGNSNKIVINIGITSGFVLFSTWTFSQLYGQGTNYENQKTKYVLSTTVLNSIASAIANRTAINTDPSGDPNTKTNKGSLKLTNADNMTLLIQYLDKQLEYINSINSTWDSTFAEESANRINTILKSADGPSLKLP